MKIIDVHIHFTDHEGFRETARKAAEKMRNNILQYVQVI